MATQKKGGTPSALPEVPRTVAEYAAHYCAISLDPSLPEVRLDAALGVELKGYLDAARTLTAGHSAYLTPGNMREALRASTRALLIEAIRLNTGESQVFAVRG